MRLKSTLWALAFACAAMSCSDDLENGPGNKNDNEKKGGEPHSSTWQSAVAP